MWRKHEVRNPPPPENGKGPIMKESFTHKSRGDSVLKIQEKMKNVSFAY
jgi:hypothetical protein